MAHRTIMLLCAPLLASAAAGCGTSAVSTGNFKGEQQKVAQTVAHLQSHATALEAQKICGEDLAAANVARLRGPSGCKRAIESQLKQVDSFEATVQSVKISGATASALVKSIYLGKNRLRTMTFVHEGGKWRITGLG